MSRFAKSGAETDAALLNFGDEFKDSHCLLHSEVQILLEACQAQRQAEELSTAHLPPPTSTFLKCHQYVSTFGRFRNREVIREVRQVMLQGEVPVHEYEMTQLANLVPESVEEARALIPRYILPCLFDDISLTVARIEDYDLQRMVDEVTTAVQFRSTGS